MSCGQNDHGQLGRDNADESESKFHMMPISPISDFPTATSVCCGYHHTIGLMRDGRAFGFGHNDHGQLGLHTREDARPVVRAKLLGLQHHRGCVE